MRVGDLLEIAAGGCFVAATLLWTGLPPALLVAGGCLAYFAQCWGKQPVPKVKLPKLPHVKWTKLKVRMRERKTRT